MLQDMVHQQGQLIKTEEVSSPLNPQLLEFCETELFQETIQNSEVASSSNRCYEEQSCYSTNLSLSADRMNNYNSIPTDQNDDTHTLKIENTSPQTLPPNIDPISISNNNINHLCLLFDPQEDNENDISASIDFTTSQNFVIPQFFTNQQDQYDLSSINNPIHVTDVGNASLAQYNPEPSLLPLMRTQLPAVYEEECFSSMPSYMRLTTSSPSCTLVDPTIPPYFPTNINGSLPSESPGIFGSGGLFLGTELSTPQELDFQGDNSKIFCPDPMPRIFDCSPDLQALSNETQHLLNGVGSSTSLTPEIASLEDPTFKVGKLSVEQRREKIHRYMKKRNERNFSKKIKYACRKTLADSRPRVRGRFAKNDDFGDQATRTTCSTHEEDTDEDVSTMFSHPNDGAQSSSLHMGVKEEEDMVDSSDIFAHISGVNSFKCNYPIQSWI